MSEWNEGAIAASSSSWNGTGDEEQRIKMLQELQNFDPTSRINVDLNSPRDAKHYTKIIYEALNDDTFLTLMHSNLWKLFSEKLSKDINKEIDEQMDNLDFEIEQVFKESGFEQLLRRTTFNLYERNLVQAKQKSLFPVKTCARKATRKKGS